MIPRFHQSLVAIVGLLLSAGSGGVDAFNVFRPPTRDAPPKKPEQRPQKPTISRRSAPLPPENHQRPKFWNPLAPDSLVDLNEDDKNDDPPPPPAVWNGLAGSALELAARLAPRSDALEISDRAACVEINRLPPQSVQIDLRNVPLVGPALSGTYTKVPTTATKSASNKPSVVISSPKDQWGAAREAAERGNLEFRLRGLFESFVDIKLEPNEAGVAPVQIRSPLIPQWPWAKQRKKRRRPSDWHRVTNLGNGEVYYFNARTGQSQYEAPPSEQAP